MYIQYIWYYLVWLFSFPLFLTRGVYSIYVYMYIVVNTGGSTVGEKLGVKVNIGTTILGIMYTVVLPFAESIERNRTIEIGGKLNKKYLIL